MTEFIPKTKDVLFFEKITKLKWFVAARYVAPTALWFSSALADFPDTLSKPIFYITTVFLLVFISYNVIVHQIIQYLERNTDRSKNVPLDFFIVAQGFIDALIITVYINVDGGVESPVFFAYAISIIMVAFLARKWYGIVYVSLVSLMYLALISLEFLGIVPHSYNRGEYIDLHLQAGTVFPDTIVVIVMFFVIFTLVRYLNRESVTLEKKLHMLIGEYRALKDNYEDLLDTAFDLIQSTSVEGKVEYVNKRWSDVLGYSKEEAQAMTMSSIVEKDDIVKYQEKVLEAKTKRKSVQYEIRMQTKDKRELVIEGVVSPRFNSQGELISLRDIMRDITRQKDVLRQVEKKAKDLEAINNEMIGREMRLIEMQKEIEKLKEQLKQKNKNG